MAAHLKTCWILKAKRHLLLARLSNGTRCYSSTPNEDGPSSSENQPVGVQNSSAGLTVGISSEPVVPAAPPGIKYKTRRVAVKKQRGIQSDTTFISPELIPPLGRRNKLLDYLERKDCFRRRNMIHIPEFYTGSILAITVADPLFKLKENRFLGICIKRKGYGLGATCTLRNVLNGEALEICYELYSPIVKKIEVIKLEKWLDSSLVYLRDAPDHYSYFDQDMKPFRQMADEGIPVNDIKVKLNPPPWRGRWERWGLKNIQIPDLDPDDWIYERRLERSKKWMEDHEDWKELDICREYVISDDILRTVQREVKDHEKNRQNK